MKYLLFAGALFASLVGLSLADTPVKKGKEAAPAKDPKPTARKLRLLLDKEVTLEKGIPSGTNLSDALEMVFKDAKVPYVLDAFAFRQIGVEKVGMQPVRLPAKTTGKLKFVLDDLLKQVRGDMYYASWMINDGRVIITTSYHKQAAVFGQLAPAPNPNPDSTSAPPGLGDASVDVLPSELRGGLGGRIYQPIYGMEFDNTPLVDALKEISESSGVNIIVDKRLGDKAKAPVSAKMNNVMVDTAARFLAAMADLQIVLYDGAIFVTTPENARKLMMELSSIRIDKVPVPGPAKAPAKNPLG